MFSRIHQCNNVNFSRLLGSHTGVPKRDQECATRNWTAKIQPTSPWALLTHLVEFLGLFQGEVMNGWNVDMSAIRGKNNKICSRQHPSYPRTEIFAAIVA